MTYGRGEARGRGKSIHKMDYFSPFCGHRSGWGAEDRLMRGGVAEVGRHPMRRSRR